MFERVLGHSQSVSLRLEALERILAIGDPQSLGELERRLGDAAVGEQVARGYMDLARNLAQSGEREAAERHLMKIARGVYPRPLKDRVVKLLRELGVDPQKEAHAQGFVVNWWMVTPLPNLDGQGLARKDFPEEVIELGKEHRVEQRRYRWQEVMDLSGNGQIDLIPLFRRTQNVVTYAFSELNAAAETEVQFKLGSDGGIACWLNGERLHFKNVTRALKVDEDTIPARLKKGKNRLLLKISQESGPWAFCFRITDREGKPVSPTTFR